MPTPLTIKKLGHIVHDSVTKTIGMLTHFIIDLDGNTNYIFQPKALNPESGKPVDRIWITSSRIEGGVDEKIELPLELLGTEDEDDASGYQGTVLNIIYHINGCCHVELKGSGILQKTGATVESCEVDTRRLKSQRMSDEHLKLSIKDKPSPEHLPQRKW